MLSVFARPLVVFLVGHAAEIVLAMLLVG
jgi:hypothetical protein